MHPQQKNNFVNYILISFVWVGSNYGTCQQNRSAILQQARSKYFFRDIDAPSWRLLENQDDNRKTIEEPELFRPLQMDDYTYNEQCEEAIMRCKEAENNNFANGIQTHVASDQAISKDKTVVDNYLSLGCHTSVQCAHKEPRVTGLTFSPKRPISKNDDFVDLLTPEAPLMSQYHHDRKQSNTSDWKSHDDRKVLITGRRLFHANSSNDQDNFSTPRAMVNLISDEDSPELQFIEERIKNTLAIQEKSSEIQFLGENRCNKLFTGSSLGQVQHNVLRDRSNTMSKKVDELYNTSLSLYTSTSSHDKENYLGKRIVQRSKWMCSPYDVATQQSINSEQHEIWVAVTALADIVPGNTDWAIKIDNIRVSWLQLGNSFKMDGWVEAWVINAFCRMLFRKEHPKSSLKHYFFNTVSEYWLEKWKTEAGRVYMKKKNIESFVWVNKAKALRQSDGLYFPTVYDSHWFVFLVDLKYRHFIFLDSYWGKESNYHKKIDNKLIGNFQETWVDAGLRPMDFNSFGRAYPNVPQQKTGNDCGIFRMKFLERFDPRNAAQCMFSQQDVPAFRVRYAHDMLLNENNTEEDKKFLAAEFKYREVDGHN